MKKLVLISSIVSVLGVAPVVAQTAPNAGGLGPAFNPTIVQFFGENQSFSAGMEFHVATRTDNDLSVPCKVSFDTGKARFEINMSKMRGASLPPGTAEGLKAAGMDTLVTISRPDIKLSYVIYPGMSSYAEMPLTNSSTSGNTNNGGLKTTPMGKETIDGHECIKNNVTVIGRDDPMDEYTVWNASDLKNFPIKIVGKDGTNSVTTLFKNVVFQKPAASVFEAPSGYTKYDDVQTMMQTEMMKKMGGGFPPH